MRGLKPNPDNKPCIDHIVASFTDAWIETIMEQVGQTDVDVASFTDAWIETTALTVGGHTKIVASFTDAWIETEHLIAGTSGNGRIFYRCVD